LPFIDQESALSLLIIFGAAFIAWLMWSSKGQKETFLSFAWFSMVVLGALNIIYLLVK